MEKEKLISWLAAWVIRGVGWTLRMRVTDRAGFLSGNCKGPLIFAYWHNRMLAVPVIYLRHYRSRKGAMVLVSRNRDAKLIGDTMARFKIGVARGSSSRGGASALMELTKCLSDGLDVNITPDGPRGPRYKLGPGIIFLAQKTGASIMPIHIEYGRCIRFKSWDGFMVPLPFSKVEVIFGDLERVPGELDEEAFEMARARVEESMKPVTY